MTIIKILRLLQILAYLVLVSQLLYYLFVMGDAMKLVGIDNFVEQRKIVDPLVKQRHVPFYYASLVLTLLTLASNYKQWNSIVFICTAIAFVCLIADVYLGQTENGPINSLIHETATGAEGVDWEELRTKWIDMIKIRAMIITTGFASLITGYIWKA